jgi:hypothetical protein
VTDLDQYIGQLVNAAPPLSDAQKDRLAALLQARPDMDGRSSDSKVA